MITAQRAHPGAVPVFPEQPGGSASQGGGARALRPEHRQGVPGVKCEVHAFQGGGLGAAVPEAELGQAQQRQP
ncbi:hypothetical protein BG28_08510 [Nesterenkonia sp. AN1]|nr:hypothetical protein BG28_08510 [Nesterenkonia sp. AN1]